MTDPLPTATPGEPRHTQDAQAFRAVFGADPEACASAPGRVNLLGEHTDYNDGFVLPIAIPQQTRVALRRNGLAAFRLHARELGRSVQFTLGDPPVEHFARYVYGCLVEAQAEVEAVPSLDIHIASEVPIGVGLSSSAALEVATLRALRQLLGLPLDDVRLALLAQQAEVRHAGVRCGLLDQMAASLADTRRALLLDTRSLARRFVSLPAGSDILVLDSGVLRRLADSGYNQRRAECEAAAATLGVSSLRDLPGLEALAEAAALPEPLGRRVRHVLSENDRVLQAADCVDASAFGALMNASHASLRDDYEVSTPDLDRLVGLLQVQEGVYGARLTGAGFGGACVALCRSGRLAAVAHAVLGAYGSAKEGATAEGGGAGRALVPAGIAPVG